MPIRHLNNHTDACMCASCCPDEYEDEELDTPAPAQKGVVLNAASTPLDFARVFLVSRGDTPEQIESIIAQSIIDAAYLDHFANTNGARRLCRCHAPMDWLLEGENQLIVRSK